MVDYTHQADVYAARVRTLFDSLIRQGFTEEQAMALVIAFTSAPC